MDDIVITAPWRDRFLLARAAPDGDADRLGVLAQRGELIRLVRGVYVTAADWDAQSPRERHVTLARAVTLMRERRLVLSHRTAAIAWNLPLLGDPPGDVHVIAWRTNGGRSDDRLVRHCLDIPPETVVLDGLEATTLARTVIDVARTSRFAEGVMVADAALARGARHDDLVAAPRRATRSRGGGVRGPAQRVARRVAQSRVDRGGRAAGSRAAARVLGP
jgi:predicted transcriptional regulator of viral defense system